MIPIALAFGLGILSAAHFPLPFGPALGAIALIGLGVGRGRGRGRTGRRDRRWEPVCLLLAVAGAGHLAAHLQTRLPPDHLLRAVAAGRLPLGAPVRVTGRLGGAPEPVGATERPEMDPKLDDVRLLLDLEEANGAPVRGRVRLTVRRGVIGWPAGAFPGDGDRIACWAVLRRPRRFGNPGAFDYPRHLAIQGIALLGTVKSPLLVERLATARGWRAGRGRVRRWMAATLTRAVQARPSGVAGSGRAARFLQAILLGDRHALAPELERLLRRSGIAHILAISGLHVALLVFLAYRGLGGLGLPERGRAGGLILLVIGYALLCGGRPSVVRAAVMTGTVLLGRCLYRRTRLPNALAGAVLLLLLANPRLLYDAGFQLTITATASLVAFTPRLMAALPHFPRPLAGLLAATGAAQAGLLPLVLTHFHQVTPGALVLNLVAVPALGGGLALGIGTLALSPVWPAGGAAGLALVDRGIAGLAWLARETCALPGASYRLPDPPGWLVLAYAALLVGHLAPLRRGWGRRVRTWTFLGCLGLLLWLPFPPRGVAVPRLTVLDVGQGAAVLLECPPGPGGGFRMLVDGGGRWGRFDLGELVVAPTLWRRGIRRLDLVVSTHADLDHAGGLPALLRLFRPHALWLGPEDPRDAPLVAAARAAGTRVVRPRAGVSLAVAPAWRLTVLHPPPRAGGGRPRPSPNDRSLVLRLAGPGGSALLAGDIERAAEHSLLAGGRLGPSDVLLVPHHGSRTSSTAPFLARVAPRHALLSVGAGNQWGHPHPEVLRRYRRTGTRLWRTDRHGAIHVELAPTHLKVWSHQSPPRAP